MFDLVADVASYPKFVPLCESMTVRSRGTVDGNETLITAMTVAYKLIRETVTTRVTLDRVGMTIRSVYVDGPFRKLDSQWRFEPTPGGRSIVHYAIDYEFRSRALALVMGAIFDAAFRRFATAFEARADEIYGRGEPIAVV